MDVVILDDDRLDAARQHRDLLNNRRVALAQDCRRRYHIIAHDWSDRAKATISAVVLPGPRKRELELMHSASVTDPQGSCHPLFDDHVTLEGGTSCVHRPGHGVEDC